MQCVFIKRDVPWVVWDSTDLANCLVCSFLIAIATFWFQLLGVLRHVLKLLRFWETFFSASSSSPRKYPFLCFPCWSLSAVAFRREEQERIGSTWHKSFLEAPAVLITTRTYLPAHERWGALVLCVFDTWHVELERQCRMLSSMERRNGRSLWLNLAKAGAGFLCRMEE